MNSRKLYAALSFSVALFMIIGFFAPIIPNIIDQYFHPENKMHGHTLDEITKELGEPKEVHILKQDITEPVKEAKPEISRFI